MQTLRTAVLVYRPPGRGAWVSTYTDSSFPDVLAHPDSRHQSAGSREGGFMSALPSPIARSGFQRMKEVASDLLIATAVIWVLPLLLGAAAALVYLLTGWR